MKDHFEVVAHPNGGYAVVGQPTEDLTVHATKRDRRFLTPYEALDYSHRLAATYPTRYSDEVREEIQERGFHGRRVWIR